MDFSKEQLAKLEAKARNLKATYVVADEGVKPNIIWGLSHKWGLIKIRFPTTHRPGLLQMAQELADKTGSELLFTFANNAVFFRKHPAVSVDDLFKE